jgi:hypothetical protein
VSFIILLVYMVFALVCFVVWCTCRFEAKNLAEGIPAAL